MVCSRNQPLSVRGAAKVIVTTVCDESSAGDPGACGTGSPAESRRLTVSGVIEAASMALLNVRVGWTVRETPLLPSPGVDAARRVSQCNPKRALPESCRTLGRRRRRFCEVAGHVARNFSAEPERMKLVKPPSSDDPEAGRLLGRAL